MRNAIVYLCMLNDKYIIGLIINAYVCRSFIKKYNLNISLVVMCDDYVYYKWKTILKLFIDDIVHINLISYKISKRYNYRDTYSSWIKYCINKWQCLKLINYDKILFMDIDVLPIHNNFFNLFNLNTPAIHFNNDINNNHGKAFIHLPQHKSISYNSFIKNIKPLYMVNASLCLFTPSLILYNKYINMVDMLFKKEGMYGHINNGPDETTLFYFFFTHNITIYQIASKYLVIPWMTKEINKTYSINYMSNIKPWLKTKKKCYPEEMIWIDLYYTIQKKYKLKQIHKLYKHYINTIESITPHILDNAHKFDFYKIKKFIKL